MKYLVIFLGFMVGVAMPGIAAAAFADGKAGSSWNGTWIGNWETGDGAQIVFAGDDLSAFYWDGDYLSDARASLSQDKAVVTITWRSGRARLTRDGDATAKIVIHENGKRDLSFALKRDE